jgi:hypothetical protein
LQIAAPDSFAGHHYAAVWWPVVAAAVAVERRGASLGISEMAEAFRPALLILPKQSGFQPTVEPTGFQPVVVQLNT